MNIYVPQLFKKHQSPESNVDFSDNDAIIPHQLYMNALIIVDNGEWAAELETMITPLGYQSILSGNSSEVLKTIKDQSVDLIICETIVAHEDTIDLLQSIPEFQCPIVFITDEPNEFIYRRTTQFKQSRFLVKPFDRFTLRSIIDALPINPIVAPVLKGIKVRTSIGQRIVLTFDKILWIGADKNYCLIHTSHNQYVLKQSLTKLSQQLDYRFIQVHKGFWVNLDHITRVNLSRRQIIINDAVIPIGKTYKEQFVGQLIDNQTVRL
jgi:two-component system LytT family response regulator